MAWWTLGTLLAVLVVLPLVVVAGLLLWVDSQGGRTWIAGQVAGATAGTSTAVTIGAIDPGLPTTLALRQVRVADADGTWLAMDAVRLDWNPWALLRGTVRIDSLRGQGITLDRLPDDPDARPEPEPGSPFDPRRLLPDLPVAISVGEVDLRDVAIAEPVAGVAARLDAHASATLTPDQGANVVVDIRRTDGVQGRLQGRADIRRDAAGGGDRLDLDLDLQEPPGGLIAALAGWPETEPVALHLTGQGPLEDLEGRITGAVGSLAALEGSYRASYAGEGEVIGLTLDLGGEVAALLEEPIRPLAAGPLTLHLDLEAGDGGGKVRVKQLALSGAALSLSASAAIDMAGGALQASLLVDHLDAAALQAFVPDLDLREPRLQVDLRGSLERPEAEVRFTAAALAMADAALDNPDLHATLIPTADLSGAELPPIDVRLDAGAGQVRLAGIAEAEDLLRRGLSLHIAGQADPAKEAFRLDEARLVLETLTLQANGDMAAEGPVRLQARLEAPDLAELGGIFGLPLQGALSADLEADGTDVLAVEPGDWHAVLTAVLAQPGFEDLPLQPLLGAQVTLDAWIEGRGTRSAELSHLQVQAENLALSGEGRVDLEGGQVTAALDLDLPVLAALSGLSGLDMAGRGAAELRLSGDLEAPALQARVTLDGATIAGTPVQHAVLQVRTERLAEPLRAVVELDGRAMDLPLRLRTDLALAAAGDRLDLAGLRADLAGLRLDGRIGLDLGTSLAEGRLQVEAPDLATVAAPFGVAATGRLGGSLVLSTRQGAQAVVLDLDLADLREAESGLAAGSADLAADLVLADGGPRGTLRLAVRRADLGDAELEEITVQAEGDLARSMLVVLSANGVAQVAGRKQPLVLAARADLQGMPPDLRGELSGIRLDLGEASLVQSGIATLQVRDGGGSIADLLLQADGGSVSVAASVAPNAIDADLQASDLPLGLAALFVDEPPVTGMVAVSVQLRLRPGQPEGQVTVTLSDLRSTRDDLRDLPPSNLTANALLSGDRLRLQAQWQVPATEPGHLVLTVPLLPAAGSLVPEPDPNGAIIGVLDWEGRLDKLALFLPGADSELAGEFEADLRISGTLDEPLGEGRIAIIDGSYGNYTTGTIVRNIQAQVEGRADSRLTIAGTASDGGTGRLTIEGHLDLDGDPLPEFSVALTAQRFTVVRLDLATGTISANLTAAGTPQRNRVEGDIRVDALAIEVDGGLPPSATVIPVTIYPRPGAAPLNPPEPPSNDRPPRSLLNITVTIPPNMTVSGRGLESTWSGDLQVRGNATNPLVTGQIRGVRGNFSLVGKRFVLSQGLISFDGSRPPNPNLTIIFTYSGREAVANVEVRGTPEAPEIHLTSTPPMPESDIISAVLFDRRSAQLSPAEALEVATSLAALTGRGDPGAGITGEVRQALGLDVLSVGSDTDGRPTLNAGRYLTDGVYVGVRQGLTSSSSSVAVQVDLTDNIQLETDVGVEATSSVGVNWKIDY